MHSGYCVKCKKMQEIKSGQNCKSKNGRSMYKGHCGVCGCKVNKFIKKEVQENKI